jgi:asparagine synthase (glutamine-hydrolysing)
VLGGDGGDELFGGYDRYFGNRYMQYYALMPKALRQHLMTRIINKVPDGFWYKSMSQKLKWVNELSFVDNNSRYARSLGHFYFTERFRNELYGDRLVNAVGRYDPEQAISYYFSSSNAKDIVDKMLFADSMIRLPDHPVMISDRTTMAHGLEARAPFMDHKLAEFAARIPASLKVHGKTLRYIQQKVAERYLPPEVMNRNKQGFSSALPYLLADEFRFLFETFLYDSHLVRDGYLNDAPIRKLLGEHLNRKVDHGNRLWLLCNSEIWYRMAIEGSPKEEIKEQLKPEPIPVG